MTSETVFLSARLVILLDVRQACSKELYAMQLMVYHWRLEDVEHIAVKPEELYNCQRKVHGPPLQEGEKVWLFTPAVPRGDSRKLHRPWTGIYKVLKKLSECELSYFQHLQNYKKRVVHFDSV